LKWGCGLTVRLLLSDCQVLQELGKHYPFEIAVGMNGRVWIKSASTQLTIFLANCIKASETDPDIGATIKRLMTSEAMDLQA
jgi:exosome complex component RRP40